MRLSLSCFHNGKKTAAYSVHVNGSCTIARVYIRKDRRKVLIDSRWYVGVMGGPLICRPKA